MDFEVSEQMETILTMVREFVDDELVPIEGEMLHGSPETVQDLVVAAQAKVRQMGLWAPNHPVEFGGLGLSMVDHGLLERGARAHSARAHVFGIAGARRRQHRDPPPARHRRATRAVPAPAGRREDPQLLLDDRAGDGRLEPGAAGDHRGEGRRRLRDQRPEVVHVVGRRRDVRDRDGRHRSRRAAVRAGEHDHRPHRHARASTWCATSA